MEKFKRMLPAILMVIFEIAVGIMLLINPQDFTIGVFIIFGAVLILCSLVMLLRYLRARRATEKALAETEKASKKNDKPVSDDLPKVSMLPLIAAIVTFVLGALFAFGAGVLYDWTALLVVFYGAIMVIKGIFKITDYFTLRKSGYSVSFLRVVIGILSIALGLVMIIFNRDARDTMFRIAAISLLVEAALDLVTLLMGIRATKKTVTVEAKVVKDLDDDYDLNNFAK